MRPGKYWGGKYWGKYWTCPRQKIMRQSHFLLLTTLKHKIQRNNKAHRRFAE